MIYAHIELHAFRSPSRALAWRRRTAAALRRADGLRFAKALTMLGTASSGGFAAGVPALHRQLLVTAWDGPPSAACGKTAVGAALLLPRRSRGSFRGRDPFAAPAAAAGGGGPGGFAALTLGRSTGLALARFVRHGTGLSSHVASAPGLRMACTAGHPLSGNATFSIWDAEADMLRFAYGPQPGGHRATTDAHRRRRILAEQVNARFDVVALEGEWATGRVTS